MALSFIHLYLGGKGIRVLVAPPLTKCPDVRTVTQSVSGTVVPDIYIENGYTKVPVARPLFTVLVR